MSTFTSPLQPFLEEIGLERVLRRLYTTLISRGTLTVLELSRLSEINRTQVYRFLEKLTALGLVEEIVDEHRKMYRTTGLRGLERLVAEKRAKVETLTASLPNISTFLSATLTSEQKDTKVLFYRGKEGIKQMAWNVLRTKGECLGYTYIDLERALGWTMAEKWRFEIVSRKIHFRDITTDKEVFSHSEKTKAPGYHDFCQTRFISPTLLTIDHQVDIYNDVIAFYSWKEGEIFGVEIYNPTIVKLQKQIFNLLWEKVAKKL